MEYNRTRVLTSKGEGAPRRASSSLQTKTSREDGWSVCRSWYNSFSCSCAHYACPLQHFTMNGRQKEGLLIQIFLHTCEGVSSCMTLICEVLLLFCVTEKFSSLKQLHAKIVMHLVIFRWPYLRSFYSMSRILVTYLCIFSRHASFYLLAIRVSVFITGS